VKIVETLGIDPNEPVSYLTAKQVNRISEREARNMAYMDELSKVPSIFRDNSLFLLPVANGRYAIVRGHGYHSLEEGAIRREEFRPAFPLETAILEPTKSEGSAIAYALNTGLISHLTGVSPVFLGAPGRFYLDAFEFDVDGGAHLSQKGAQAEIDGFFYGRNAAMVMEFKAHHCEDFLIRQLYYPFRHWSGRADRYGWSAVRPYFVDFDWETTTYRFFEYDFSNPTDYESIHLVAARSIHVVPRERPLRGILEVSPDPGLAKLTPQADKIERVLRVPFEVAAGNQNAFLLAEQEGFTTRQSSYYRRAAEALGLVNRSSGEYRLTELGRKFVRLSDSERNDLVAVQLARIPAFNEIFHVIGGRPGRQIDRSEIGGILRANDVRIHGSTIPRRVQTVLSWLRWVQSATGILTVDATGVVRSSPRLSLA
jgi:C-terminal AAA-associated domain